MSVGNNLSFECFSLFGVKNKYELLREKRNKTDGSGFAEMFKYIMGFFG